MRGVLGDESIDDERKRAARQEKQRNCYHNTEMLLKHYREIAWSIECFPRTVAEELDRPFEDTDSLIDQMDTAVAMGNKKLESRMAGVQKSRLLLDRVNEALTVLKKKPDNGKKLSRTELLYRLDISSRHYYRLRQQAITILSIRLWAAPTADVDFWLEMLTLLEGLE